MARNIPELSLNVEVEVPSTIGSPGSPIIHRDIASYCTSRVTTLANTMGYSWIVEMLMQFVGSLLNCGTAHTSQH
eukprot:2456238-Rhodomonas_salina.2